MDQDIKQLLLKNIEISEENARMIRGIRTSMRIATAWKVFYVLFFLGGLVWAYQYIQPYYNEVRSSYNTIVETQTQVKEGINKFLPR